MTREEILGMEAGRELDELISKEVFKNIKAQGCSNCLDNLHGCIGSPNYPKCYISLAPYYSTDISAAWEAVEHLKTKGIYGRVDVCKSNYAVCFQDDNLYNFCLNAKTAPLAICRSALLAVVEASNDHTK